MPLFEGVHFKLNLQNHLIIDDLNRSMSYTYYKDSFEYDTMDLFEFLNHALSLSFMLYGTN